MTKDAVLVLVVAFAQVAFLRISQYVLPQFYFSSGSLFLVRSEVRWQAILFRLAIPFAAGFVVVLLGIDNSLLAASVAGATAWFLVLWPILWAPAVMVPPVEQRRALVFVWVAFWIAFTVLPVSGAALMDWIRDVLTEPNPIWWQLPVAGYLLLALPTTLLTLLAGRTAEREVTFVDDEPEGDELEEEDWEVGDERTGWLQPAPWHLTAALFSIVLIPFILVAMLIALIARGRK